MDPINLIRSIEYLEWFSSQTKKNQSLVALRLARIQYDYHFGDFKYLGDELFELRWKNGRRIYYTKLIDNKIFLLIGGFKNGQKKDIKKARILLQRYEGN